MKGIILASFVGWVESTRGFVVCDEVINRCADRLTTGGAYTSVGDYPAAEFTMLAGSLAEMESTSADAIMRDFGVAAFEQLGSLHPEWLEGMPDLISLLSRIEPVIHVEVRKLYSDSQPPLIRARQDDDGAIYVTYESHRDLVALCHGLIEGAARHYGERGAVEMTDRTTVDGRTHATFLVESNDGN
ncbi:MAG: heme NO-binding domain-containing protein [Candidatus Nanopelagicales bacterium]